MKVIITTCCYKENMSNILEKYTTKCTVSINGKA